MTLAAAVGLGKAASRLAAVFFLLAALAVTDILTEGFRKDFNTFQVLPGQATLLNGPLPPKAAEITDIRIRLSPETGLTVRLDDIYKGYWLGGAMLKGQATADPSAAPGSYRLELLGPEDVEAHPTMVYVFKVYADEAALRLESPSFFTRYLDIPPKAAAVGSFILALCAGAAVYILGGRQAALLLASGRAEIYVAKRTPEGVAVTFGLGRKNGLAAGASVTLLDPRGAIIGRAAVTSVTETDASALAEPDAPVRVGCLASLDVPGKMA